MDSFLTAVTFSVLVGKTITRIERVELENEALRFYTNDGAEYVMTHRQDCCESVSIEDINGDTDDLLNTPVLIAEERTDGATPRNTDYVDESFTWTFYTLRTIKGTVTIRWYGSSNGWYSESVDFIQEKEANAAVCATA